MITGMARRVYFLCLMIALFALPAEGRRVGMMTTIAGTGEFGYAGDGKPAIGAVLDTPSGVAVDAKGHIYIADSFNHRVRRIDAVTGIITTVAGDGYRDHYNNGRYFRNDWPATEVSLSFPTDLAIDPFGHLYILDRNNYRVRRMDASSGILVTVAGNGNTKWTYSPDWSLATEVDLHSPSDIALADDGDLLISDAEDNRLRRVDLPSGIILTLAGNLEEASNGDGKSARSASLGHPGSIAVSPRGEVFVVDGIAHTVRRIDAVSHVITTYAGGGDPPDDSLGDGGPATAARVSASGLAFDPDGNLHIVGGGRVRRVDAQTKIITTVAGGGTFLGDTDEAVIATKVRLSRPTDIAFDPDGNLYIAELAANRIRKVVFVDMPDRSADFDQDGRVGFSDFLLMVSAFGSTDPVYDLDEDGQVGRGDIEMLAAVFGQRIEAE